MNRTSGPTYMIHCLACLIFITMISCDTDTADPELMDRGYDYYPLEIGNYNIYEVIDVQYEVTSETDSSFYFLKEVVADTFFNQNRELTYLIKRYRRPNDTIAWEDGAVETWKAVRSETNLIVFEKGIPFVKLIFPVENFLSWNGNAFNHIDTNSDDRADDDEYTYVNVNNPYEVNDNLWDNTLTVEQNDLISLVERDTRYEIYAKDTGLIFKEFIRVDYVGNLNDPQYGKDEIQSGVKYIQTLIEHGKE